MQNKALAEMVLQKIKEKKEQQLRNMPHFKVLQLQATFEIQHNHVIKSEIGELQQKLTTLQNTLGILQQQSQQLDFTGKRNFPRIIVKPEFIASEIIQPKLKEFYRKLSNTFLRQDLLRKKKANRSLQVCSALSHQLDEVNALEKKVWTSQEERRREINGKRRRVLQQELRLQVLNSQIVELEQTIKREREERIQILKEFELKKGGLQSRKQRLVQVQDEIQFYKGKLQEQFTPLAYRQHLAKIHTLQTKNQIILQNIQIINEQIAQHNQAITQDLKHSGLLNKKQLGLSRRRQKLKTESQIQWTNDRTLNLAAFNKYEGKSSSQSKMRLRSEQSQFFGRKSAFLKRSDSKLNETINK